MSYIVPFILDCAAETTTNGCSSTSVSETQAGAKAGCDLDEKRLYLPEP